MITGVWGGVEKVRPDERALRLLREMRESTGLSQRALAQQIGVSHTTISNIEDGEKATSLELLSRWAAACGSDLSQVFPEMTREHILLLISELPKPEFELVAKLAKLVQHLPQDYRSILEGMFDIQARELGITEGVIHDPDDGSTSPG